MIQRSESVVRLTAVIDPCLQCIKKNTNGVTCAALRERLLKNMSVSFQSAGLLETVWCSRNEKVQTRSY